MIVIVAQDRADTDMWNVHYRRGEELVDDIRHFAMEIVESDLTSYAMLRLKDTDYRQRFQNRTVQRLRLDPEQFLIGGLKNV
jgi:hypothetical protein